MGGQNSGRQPLTFGDWQGDIEKRALNAERRPQIRNASDLLGPGIAPNAVQLSDWDDEATAFNGLFYSEPGALHGPDNTSYWMGVVQVTEAGFGYQRVRRYFSAVGSKMLEEWGRTFADPGSGARDYTGWQLWSDPTPLGDPITSWSETPPNDRYLFANGQSVLIADYPDLFALYGIKNGSDDATHFNLPDMRGRFPQGSHANLAHPPGNVDTVGDPADRLAVHTHSVAQNNDHTHGGGTLHSPVIADRASGLLGRADNNVTLGQTALSGGHDHGGVTGESAHAEFPHFRWAYHVRVRL